MESQSGCIFCHHCSEHVSESTYRRHQLLGIKRKHAQIATLSDSESESDMSIDSDFDSDSYCAKSTTVEAGDLEEGCVPVQSDDNINQEDQVRHKLFYIEISEYIFFI